MPSTKIIKQRIQSVKNTSQITKAMEAVSATKMRRSQGFALSARPYAVASLTLLQGLLRRLPESEKLPEVIQPRPVRASCLMIITSDKGLAGALNANVLRRADSWIENQKKTGIPFALIAVGKKAKEYCERKGIPAEHVYTGFGDYARLSQTRPIADALLAGFRSGRWDEVEAAYTNFRTTLSQQAILEKILSATEKGLAEAVAAILPERGRFAYVAEFQKEHHYNYEYVVEPSPAAVLEILVPQLIRMHIHHIILESNASEHSARMVAMKNASESAAELIETLTLQYNKARQAGITQELVEITAGREALA
ncbi:MAG: ATP synthase F1 subunit gamma [Candidatus Sungbacteria bacterium]|nr:ATP synthase F1 subunit gamma [Candidatus Sungbacteria bacterium]